VQRNLIWGLSIFLSLNQTAESKWVCNETTNTIKDHQSIEGPCGQINLKYSFGSSLVKANYTKAKFKPNYINEFYIAQSTFEKSQWNFMNVNKTKFKGVNFSGAQIKGTKFINVDFSNVNFSSSDLAGTQFVNCQFDQVLFTGANLSGTVFQFNNFINTQLPENSGYFLSGNTSQ